MNKFFVMATCCAPPVITSEDQKYLRAALHRSQFLNNTDYGQNNMWE